MGPANLHSAPYPIICSVEEILTDEFDQFARISTRTPFSPYIRSCLVTNIFTSFSSPQVPSPRERFREREREKGKRVVLEFQDPKTPLHSGTPLPDFFSLLSFSPRRGLYCRTTSSLAPCRVIEDTDKFPTLRRTLPRLTAVTLRVPTEPLLHLTLQLETLLVPLQPSPCETISQPTRTF